MQLNNGISANTFNSAIKWLMVRILPILVFMGIAKTAVCQVSPEILRASLIVTCAEFAEWKEFKDSKVFTIGVYGSLAEEINPLREMAKQHKIDGREIQVVQFRRVRDIYPTDVLFVNNRFNEDLEKIFETASLNKTLLITDRAPSDKYFMINLLLQSKDQQFEVDYANAKSCDANLSEKLTNQGGSTLDLQNLYQKKKKELELKEEKLRIQSEQIKDKQAELETQIERNKELTRQNKEMAEVLSKAEKDVKAQELQASILMEQVKSQQNRLALNMQKLAERDAEIEKKKQEIEEANEKLLAQQEELLESEAKVNEQIEATKSKTNIVNDQQTKLTILVIFLGLFIFMVILIVRSMRERKRANLALQKTNKELNQQKDEINKQAEQLENVNKELEKLSIVAGKTQNAIVIMDRNGYYEWVNAGFTRFFGYTLQLLRNELDENIVNVCTNKGIRNILFKCVSNKQTIVFESEETTRQGKLIASQVTLSPILNDKGDVTQLVAIYSDINKLKEQEAAIRRQNEELMEQKTTLEVQKNQIEEQTKSIKAGIYYAQTIQQTILPPKSEIDKMFDSFVLFRPKDIVSGDFYWYSEAVDGDKNYQFVGDFDCTGHGVPGAFMSLIGNRILNEVINVRHIYSPRDIMDELNANVIKALKQDQSTNNDGMDTCLCRVEKLSFTDYKVTFCGAKRPLYYLTTSSDTVEELKGDRKSIGGTQKKRGNIQFTDQDIILHSGDVIILCSDGISDQCDKDRKKFSSDRLRSIILQNRNETMERQGELLSKALDDYRGDEEQRDDISVIGIKFK